MKKALLNRFIIMAMMIGFWTSSEARTMDADKSVSTVVPICSGNQLALKEVEGESAMGGKVMGNFVFTNVSSTACTLSGYPSFILLDKSGKVMRGVKIIYGDALAKSSPEIVTLEPKQTAWFRIFYSTGFGYDLKKAPASAAKVKISVPKTKAFVLKSDIAAYREVRVNEIRAGLPD